MSISLAQFKSLYRFNTDEGAATDSIGTNDLTIVGASTVPGVIKQGLFFDSINDLAYTEALITEIASETEGTIPGWCNLDELKAKNAQATIFNVISGANTTTEMWCRFIPAGADNFSILIYCKPAGAIQWQFQVNFAYADFGSNMQYSLAHDGIEPRFYADRVNQVLNYTVTTDKTCWMKALVTDAAFTPATHLVLGARRTNGLTLANTTIDITGYTSQVFGVAENVEFYNDGLGNELVITTTTGVSTAEPGTDHDINVIMPYTDDFNANSTYTINYKLSSESNWTNWVTDAPNTPSPYINTITGLEPGTLYDVKCTYNDVDGVVGDNPQIISNILIPSDPKSLAFRQFQHLLPNSKAFKI